MDVDDRFAVRSHVAQASRCSGDHRPFASRFRTLAAAGGCSATLRGLEVVTLLGPFMPKANKRVDYQPNAKRLWSVSGMEHAPSIPLAPGPNPLAQRYLIGGYTCAAGEPLGVLRVPQGSSPLRPPPPNPPNLCQQ